MSNFHVNFSVSPWLLLLVVPALFFTLLPYFRLAKKYRRNRNRIASIILHSVVMLLTVSVLAGIYFTYDVPNTESEVILLVDASFSGEGSEEERDAFIQDVLDENDSVCKVGIVTFGFDQVYAAELSHDADAVFEAYKKASLPDITATDIASALRFSKDLFTNPETAKIVLISDGAETDGDARSAIKSVLAEGIGVDLISFPNEISDEIEIIDVTLPEISFVAGETFELEVTLNSNHSGSVDILMNDFYEGGEVQTPISAELSGGKQTVKLEYAFSESGFHELLFQINGAGDTTGKNNDYYTYVNLQLHNKLLILERYEGEAEHFNGLLDQELDAANGYETDVICVENEPFPADLGILREYDQIVLVNIAHSDMPEGFENMLYTYVNDIGGGLLTIGGNERDEVGNVILDSDGNPIAHAYDREDMKDTLYQDLLPVEAVEYTPPVGVVIIIDHSSSMSTKTASGLTRLDLAKTGALSSLDALTERDWCGIMTLEDSYVTQLSLTPMTQRIRIEAAIANIEKDAKGGTMFRPALERACIALSSLSNVERRHIILVTDGEPYDYLDEQVGKLLPYGEVIDAYREEYGITFSIAAIDIKEENLADMAAAALRGGGNFYNVSNSDVTQLPSLMLQELTMSEIKSVEYGEYQPQIYNRNSIVSGISQDHIPVLDGFYGTKVKSGQDVEVPLMGKYVPIYAQWTYGKGKVGSFMCDLSGYWSSDFLTDPTGVQLIGNIVKALLPTHDLREQEIDAVFLEDNYTTQVSVYTDLAEGETIEARITGPSLDGAEPTVQTILPSAKEGYSRFSFVIKQPGIHTVEILKKDAAGNVLASYEAKRVLSYSKEYELLSVEERGAEMLTSLSENEKVSVVESAEDVYDDFVEYLHKTADPRLPFMIIAIVLFLLDIAARKFKFKWPHEIVRDRRASKEMMKK